MPSISSPHGRHGKAGTHGDGRRRLARRERQLLEWLAAGHAPQQVARRIGRPVADVTRHLGLLLARFGADGAAELLARAPAPADDDVEGEIGDDRLEAADAGEAGPDAACTDRGEPAESPAVQG